MSLSNNNNNNNNNVVKTTYFYSKGGIMLSLLLFIFVIQLQIQICNGQKQQPVKRHIDLHNECGSRIEVYWVHPNTNRQKVSLMSKPGGIMFGGVYPIDSFVSHEFEVRELPHSKTGVCLNGKDPIKEDKYPEPYCSKAYFIVNDNHDQVLKIVPSQEEINENRVIRIDHVDDKTIARENAELLVNDCKKNILNEYYKNKDNNNNQNNEKLIDNLASCINKSFSNKMEEIADEISFQQRIRLDNFGSLYENYTCFDDNSETSKIIESKKWIHSYNNKVKGRYDVHVLHKHFGHYNDTYQIHLIDDFITDDECSAIQSEAEPNLVRAQVANHGHSTTTTNDDGEEKGRISNHRRAMQAEIIVPKWWESKSSSKTEDQSSPISILSRRIYSYVNNVLNLDIKPNGQENLVSIQYFGKDVKKEQQEQETSNNDSDDNYDNNYDQYLSHCDADCSGDYHRDGMRIATMIMYCTVPKKGGSTNFRNIGVHVKPKKNSALFFTYYSPTSKKMDKKFTEHSGCPVIEGTKRIVTQWIRLGVNDTNPWYNI